METLRCALYAFYKVAMYFDDEVMLAATTHARHPICHAFKEQGSEEAVTFLLGGLPEVRRQWQAETGNDSCSVSRLCSYAASMLRLGLQVTPYVTTS